MKKEIEKLDLEKLSLTDAYARTSAMFRMESIPIQTYSVDDPDPFADYVYPDYLVKQSKDGDTNSMQNDANATVRFDRREDALRQTRGKDVFLGSRTRPGLRSVGKNANSNVRDRTVSVGTVRRPPPVRDPHNGTVRGRVAPASLKTHAAYAKPERRYTYSSTDRKWTVGPET